MPKDIENAIIDSFSTLNKVSKVMKFVGVSRWVVNKVLRKHHLKPSFDSRYYRGSRENHPRWKGGKSVGSNGYVRVKMPEHQRALSNGYVWEHILVAEQKLGRALRYFGKLDLRNESVHHIDGDKTNNDPNNLMICDGNSEHILTEWKENPNKFPQSKETQAKDPERYQEWKRKNEARHGYLRTN